MQADIGLIGLAVMDRNLALNIDRHGFTAAVFNRTLATVDEFPTEDAQWTNIIGAHTYERIDRPCGEFFHTDWSKPTTHNAS